jgi:hypothetical protein
LDPLIKRTPAEATSAGYGHGTTALARYFDRVEITLDDAGSPHSREIPESDGLLSDEDVDRELAALIRSWR